MKKFARLFDLEDGSQMLYTLNYDSEADVHVLNVRSDFDRFSAEISMKSENDGAFDKTLDELDINKAERLREKMKKEKFHELL